MKIQCDVCNTEEASVFCSADEAALCHACDHHVHHANKLAGKHHRFSLLHPSSQDAPPCDICQEKRGFLFCQEDRAILCRDCDLAIHSANEHTQKHNRLLLTGVKLSASSAIYTTTSPTSRGDAVLDCNKLNKTNKSKPGVSVSPATLDQPPICKSTITTTNTTPKLDHDPASEVGSTSSISEYLIEMLPGWCVEDLLDSTSTSHGLCKTDDTFERNLSSLSSDDLGVSIPQDLPALAVPQYYPHHLNGFNDSNDGFTVPQISLPPSKRSRLFW